ncbi:TetR/AcrR family transcriptional regulator [Streptomyces cavernicola]|uniref:TetR/AcrR family transcriptional regulator n=1 Tax=Streptomyces cavernicola TaxID=3043613 RepID=A0ABT6SCH7_9ACTN|nr:TetR/AcrR family transcriptional regulator [Streptomyces sp. B-S-A6]MDI3405674.1 TetR/AcrR family transcriptional regulator [Streptomyces sp. B-S-A6]
MARPSTKEERRLDILAAARALLLRWDTEVKLPDVAKELGVTPNAIRYYYPDVEELMRDMHIRATERFYTRRVEAAESVDDARERLAITIAAGLPTGPDDTEWRLLWRTLIASGVERGRSEVTSSVYHRQVGLYQSILEVGQALGQFSLSGRAIDVARTLMALEDYLGFRVIAHDPAFDRATALRMVRDYAELATSSELPPTT